MKLKLQEIRKRKKMTQEDIAFELDISQKAYSDIENGKTQMKTEMMHNLANILGVSPKEICLNSCLCNVESEDKLKKVLDYLKNNNISLPENLI
ncbi:MAG: helix-turn-helix transcriptional regulator [Cruoricaptor ignavus]|nr:helix-turn-helix transcriptional regulator [Cruoricaptor ignavus]